MNIKKTIVLGAPFLGLMLLGFAFGNDAFPGSDLSSRQISSLLISEELGTESLPTSLFKAQVTSTSPKLSWHGCTDSDGGKYPETLGEIQITYSMNGSAERTQSIKDQNFEYKGKSGIVEFYCINENRPKAKFVECETIASGVCDKIKEAKFDLEKLASTDFKEYKKLLTVIPQDPYLDVYTDISFQITITNNGEAAGSTVMTDNLIGPKNGGLLSEIRNEEIKCAPEAACSGSLTETGITIEDLAVGETATISYTRDLNAFGIPAGEISEATDSIKLLDGTTDTVLLQIMPAIAADQTIDDMPLDDTSESGEIDEEPWQETEGESEGDTSESEEIDEEPWQETEASEGTSAESEEIDEEPWQETEGVETESSI